MSFRVELALLGSELFFETLNLAGRVGENVLHFSLMVGVDFVELELFRRASSIHSVHVDCHYLVYVHL